MLTPNLRFLALPLIALMVITALGFQGARDTAGDQEASVIRAPAQKQMADAPKISLVR